MYERKECQFQDFASFSSLSSFKFIIIFIAELSPLRQDHSHPSIQVDLKSGDDNEDLHQFNLFRKFIRSNIECAVLIVTSSEKMAHWLPEIKTVQAASQHLVVASNVDFFVSNFKCFNSLTLNHGDF